MVDQSVTDQIMELYEEYPKFCKRVQGRVGGTVNAEDVVQEAFSRALRYKESYRDGTSIGGWFNRILINAVSDFNRIERLNGLSDGHEEEEGTDLMDNLQFRTQLVGKVLGHLDEYDDETREVIEAYYVYGWLPREIAEFSALTPGNIRVIIHRFKEAMRQRYGQEVCS
jgi:RNA polymerase sigma-70 factor (ECF subfamily)